MLFMTLAGRSMVGRDGHCTARDRSEALIHTITYLEQMQMADCCFEVRDIPGRGRGLVASRDLQVGRFTIPMWRRHTKRLPNSCPSVSFGPWQNSVAITRGRNSFGLAVVQAMRGPGRQMPSLLELRMCALQCSSRPVQGLRNLWRSCSSLAFFKAIFSSVVHSHQHLNGSPGIVGALLICPRQCAHMHRPMAHPPFSNAYTSATLASLACLVLR